MQKVECIRLELDATLNPTQSVETAPTASIPCFDSFESLSEENVRLLSKSSKKSSTLDPMPAPLVAGCLDVLLPVLTRMINLSLESGVFPENWKQADVRPRLKKSGLEVAFKNLRPISNLSFTSKLTERVVFNQMYNEMKVHNLYPKAHSAHREFHSTETALLHVKHDILMNMNKKHVTLLVLLDLSAAFDTVDHSILLDRLHSSFGISGPVLSWFSSYLNNRSQFISLNGATSKLFNLQYSVPQGSCPGPLLFVIYASKLFSVLEHHLPDVHAYADDTQLYISFKPDSGAEQSKALTALENGIDDIKRWMLADKLKLNDDKTDFIIIGTRQRLKKVTFNTLRVSNTQVTSLSQAKNLGSWFDTQMNLNTHVTNCCQAAFFHLFNIRRIRKFLNHETVQILVNAFVTSRLDYCNSLLYGLPATQLNKLQRVQNAAARLICTISCFDHISPILFELHWLPIKYRINFKILLITYKALHGLAPNYITELITVKPLSRFNLGSDGELFLQRPTIKSSVTLGDRSFALAAPTLWNELPTEIHHANSILTFKKLLKTFLLKKAFCQFN